MRIEVSQEDIDNGEPMDCDYCPVALAVNRNLPPGWRAKVAERLTLWRDGQLAGFLSVPYMVAEFIDDFDHQWDDEWDEDEEDWVASGCDPMPFSFELPIEELLAEAQT